jgi:two-component system chemotaxis sensor kinase CheA
VVHETVTGLDGSVAVDSTLGEGTTVTLRLPLTVAIVKVLFVIVGDREFGIPLKQVDEVTGDATCETIQGAEVIEHGEAIYPVIDLAETLAIGDGDGDGAGSGTGMLIRIRPEDRRVALRCGAVTGQEEVVVKPLEGRLAGTDGLSGTAVLGAGNIVPILDVTTL